MKKRPELDGLDVDELLRRGIAAARVDDKVEARRVLTEVVARDPARADAWLWLAGIETSPRAKRDHFRRVLELRPDDAEAADGLAHLAERYGESVLSDDPEEVAARCTWHPAVETLLTCARCARPMCVKCAVRHPVGMRCRECAREMRSPIYSVTPVQALTAFGVSLAGGSAAGAVLVALGQVPFFFWIISLLLGSAMGTALADAGSRAAGRKRGRVVIVAVAAGAVLGVFVPHIALAAVTGVPLGPRVLFIGFGRALGIGSLLYCAAALVAIRGRLR